MIHPPPSKARRWWLACRPKTLGLSVSPVLVGSTLAWAEQGHFQPAPAAAALAAAMLIQIGTNLHNDAADFERGADTAERLGPPRATAQGWFDAAQVKRAALLSFGLAWLLGGYLAWVGGWPIVALGLLSLLAGWAYTGGPRPIAYGPFGELFVFLFFGLGGVLGSYWLQAQRLSPTAAGAAVALGLMAAAVLLVNNYRDRVGDAKAGRRTLVHRIGPKGARRLYGLLLGLPFLLPLSLPGRGPWLVLLAAPAALWLTLRFRRESRGLEFNLILANTARLQLAFSLLLSIGVAIS